MLAGDDRQHQQKSRKLSSSTNSSSGIGGDGSDVRDHVMMEQMEMNFFHNQPDSMKKAVDFFAERIASNLIKVTI